MSGEPTPVLLELKAGVAHIVLDAPGRSANVMDDAYGEAMESAVARLRHLISDPETLVRGVVVRSTKRTFFAGGDVEAMLARPSVPEAWRWRLEQVQRPLRVLETCGVPVVAAINGAAMGGGLEIALAAHHRVAVAGDYPLGLPEVTLGVLAASGGVSRTVRMLGLVTALECVLLSGRTHLPEEALALGLVDEVVADPADLLPAALAWLEQSAGHPASASRAWDWPGFNLPSGATATREAERLRVLEEGVADALPEAPRAVLRAAIGGASLGFEESAQLEIEQFLHLATRPEFAVTLRAAFLDRRELARAHTRDAAASGGGVKGEAPVVGRLYIARLDSALCSEIARVEADGVASHHVTAICARLGLLCGYFDRQALDQPGPADCLVDGIDREVADRLLFAVSIEAVAALQDGTATSAAEANVLSIDDIGFPTVLGGAIGHVLHHVRDGRRAGPDGFLQRSRQLSATHGPRFELSSSQSTFLTHLTEQEAAP